MLFFLIPSDVLGYRTVSFTLCRKQFVEMREKKDGERWWGIVGNFVSLPHNLNISG